MRTRSHSLIFSDFDTRWYARWSQELKQSGPDRQLDGFKPHSNKFWQNAILCQILKEHGMLQTGRQGIGFGVGNERLPALLAKYGVSVTATDQDFRSKKAKHWSKGELATGLASLNKYGICDDTVMKERVDYIPVDMNSIPKDLYNSFDFVWSNCSLGHLGSLQKGLNFIENSLACLKPGGVAVHSTEVSIVSDTDTVKTGDTVILRLSDIKELYTKLTHQGYECLPLHFRLGRSADDVKISMFPQFGNDFSKIQVSGHIATQVVLIIKRPQKKLSPYKTILQQKAIQRAHKNGLKEMQAFKLRSKQLLQIDKYQELDTSRLHVIPSRKTIQLSFKKKDPAKTIYLTYENTDAIDFYCHNGTPNGCNPLILATDDPADRNSSFFNARWFSPNRPSAHLLACEDKSTPTPLDHVPAGSKFMVPLHISPKGHKPGIYTETYCLVLEGRGWIPASKTIVQITIK